MILGCSRVGGCIRSGVAVQKIHIWCGVLKGLGILWVSCGLRVWGMSGLRVLEEPWLAFGRAQMAEQGAGVCVLMRDSGPISHLHYSLACPGGPRSPCSDHGVCVDGISGSGQCNCHPGFAGTACELCAPGAFGPQCQGKLSLCCPFYPAPFP